jgi:hypothetical protein
LRATARLLRQLWLGTVPLRLLPAHKHTHKNVASTKLCLGTTNNNPLQEQKQNKTLNVENKELLRVQTNQNKKT